MIRVQNVSKNYGSRLAVQDLNFTVKKGEVVGLLGPNGAGKTTTMKMLTGYMVPTSGEIFIDGQNIFEHPIAAKKKLGYLPEIPPIYGDMYVHHYLHYVAQLKCCPKKQIRSLVDTAIDKTDLGNVRRRLIRNLSKGFQQRVGLAQALVSNPEILILDEPTIGMDPNQVIEIRSLIAQLKGQHTIILSTHILKEVETNCDRVIIIKEGKLITQESLTSLKETQSQNRRQINVRVRQFSPSLMPSLLELQGVLDVHSTKNTDKDKTIHVFVGTEAGHEINELIAKQVINNGVGLMELRESFNLEDVFLQLTKKDQS